MATAVRTFDLSDLRAAAATTPALCRYVDRLALLQQRIEERCAGVVLWAVALGGFLNLIGTGKQRSTARMQFLFVTNLQSVYESYDTLADRVLGPILAETGWFIDYRAWTLGEFRRIAELDTSELLHNALTEGVTLFGSPPYPGAD